jgi:hypothetical protein
MAIIPPSPFHENPDSFNPAQEMSNALMVRPQLFFRVKLRPYAVLNAQSDISLELMFVSAFEKCDLTPYNPIQQAGMQMYYDPSPVPVLYVGHIKHALCRVPLMPVFLNGNDTPTIPSNRDIILKKTLEYPYGRYDTFTGRGASKAKVLGSRLYEINFFLWQYAKGTKRTQPFSEVLESRRQHKSAILEKRKRVHLARKRPREEPAESDSESD